MSPNDSLPVKGWRLLICGVTVTALWLDMSSWLFRFCCSVCVSRMRWSASSCVWSSPSATARTPSPNWWRSSGSRPLVWVSFCPHQSLFFPPLVLMRSASFTSEGVCRTFTAPSTGGSWRWNKREKNFSFRSSFPEQQRHVRCDVFGGGEAFLRPQSSALHGV